jgi:positive regulator of sigma E activity
MVTEFPCLIAKVATQSDGGIRVALDLQEDAVVQAAQLMELKRLGVLLICKVYPAQENGPKDD